MPRQNVRKKFPKQLEFAKALSHTISNCFPVCVLPGESGFGGNLAGYVPYAQGQGK